MKLCFSALTLLTLLTTLICPEIVFAGEVPFIFATADQGRKILTAHDDFVQRLSPFDRAARMKTDKSVSKEKFLKFVSAQLLEWSEDDKADIQSVLSDIRPRLEALSLPWPESIYLVRTTGNEEGNTAYTRANAIVLPTGMLKRRKKELLRAIVAHELFHILSRHNPLLKEKLYAIIGFMPCGEVAFPSKLIRMKITNPDAPKNDHCIRIVIENKRSWVLPILFSNTEKYDVKRGGEFLNYLQLKFLRVDGETKEAPSAATYDDAHLRLAEVSNVAGFFRKIGRNTEYIIHPEEILADNFSLLLRGAKNVPSPEILTQMEEVLGREKLAKTTRR